MHSVGARQARFARLCKPGSLSPALIAAQRRQVAHYAGEQWQLLLDYLSGKLKRLPES